MQPAACTQSTFIPDQFSILTALWLSKHDNEHRPLQYLVSLFDETVLKQTPIAYQALTQVIRIDKFKRAGGRGHVMECFEKVLNKIQQVPPQKCVVTTTDGHVSINRNLLHLIFPKSATIDISQLPVSTSTLELAMNYVNKNVLDWEKGIENYLEFIHLCAIFDELAIRDHIFQTLLQKIILTQETLVVLNSNLHTDRTPFDKALLKEITLLTHSENHSHLLISDKWRVLDTNEKKYLLSKLDKEVPSQNLSQIIRCKNEKSISGAIIRALITAKELVIEIDDNIDPDTTWDLAQDATIQAGLKDPQQLFDVINKTFHL